MSPTLLLLALVPLPGTTSVSVALSPPIACSRCHSGFDGSAHDTWSGSVMGHAARDPVFLAALTIAEEDVPGVGDLCLRCHAPEAWLQGRCEPTIGSALEEDDSGVTCSFCHRSQPNPYLRNAQYIVADDSVMRGPYADAQAPHTNRQAPWISDARLCGTCHDLYNPLVPRRNLDGSLAGYGFPEQTTYTEWATSAFADPRDPMAQGCRDCHMPEDGVPAIVAQNGPDRPDRSSHALSGANAWMLETIEFLFPQLGLGDRLAAGRAAIRETLRRAATLELQNPPTELERGQAFTLTVRVTNLTGHKLPTGYPEGRQVYLSVRSATLGLDRGAFDRVTYEPLAPLAQYHAVHGQAGRGPGHHIALNDTIYLDTRIPPRGMVVTGTTAPVGKTYPEVAPGVLAHWDDVTVTATVPCDVGVERVDGEFALLHQVMTQRYIDALVTESASVTPERAARLQSAWDAIPATPEAMAELRFSIPVRADSRCAPPDAGFVDTGVMDAAPARADVDGGVIAAGDAAIVSDTGVVEGDGPGGDCGCNVSAGTSTDVPSAWIVLASLIWLARRRQWPATARTTEGT